MLYSWAGAIASFLTILIFSLTYNFTEYNVERRSSQKLQLIEDF